MHASGLIRRAWHTMCSRAVVPGRRRTTSIGPVVRMWVEYAPALEKRVSTLWA